MAELTVPQVDFGILGNLRTTYEDARKDAVRQRTLASLGQGDGQIDPRTLIGSGDLSLANLGIAVQNRQQDQARQTRLDERQLSRDSVDDNFRRQSLALQQRAAARADEGPVEKAAARARVAGQYGIQQGTPEFKAFVLTGELPASASKIPAGFESDPATGGLKPIAGGPADPAYLRTKGDRQNAPSGYRWVNPEKPNEGMVPIPGGPGEKVDAEVAGRLGLARSFLGQLPEIRKRVEAGEITGPIDAGMAKLGMGGPGEIRRQMDSGAEALLRMLTGAGMNMEEAKEYTRRYRFDPTDNSKTVVSKLNQLERELNSVGETVGKGRGGWTPPGAAAAQTPSGNVTSSGVKWSVQ